MRARSKTVRNSTIRTNKLFCVLPYESKLKEFCACLSKILNSLKVLVDVLAIGMRVRVVYACTYECRDGQIVFDKYDEKLCHPRAYMYIYKPHICELYVRSEIKENT